MFLFITILLLFLNFIIGRLFGYLLGRHGTCLVFFFNLSCVFFILSYYMYCQLVSILPIVYEINLGYWIKLYEMEVEWLFLFDRLAISMSLMIIIISILVHAYSFSYMKSEPQLIKFLSFLSLFTAFMFILVNAGNFLVLFLGWEGVGLCSYLLISFWTTRIPAGKAGLKALFMNRIGDFFLLIAICFFFKYFKTINFDELFVLYPYYDKVLINIFGEVVYLKEFLAFLLVFASIGKSAQIGLHTWLPDAMEGPTPVSALIHAATMVTAGIYLLIRCSYFFVATPYALNFIVSCGLLTCIVSALIATVQYDLKKIIAYSTCSQLGYMFYSCGVLNFSASLFHLVNHAFFKALLFLSAGAIIHALNGEQDIRRMGNLRSILPFYYLCFVIATLSLSGFIFFSGYYSKDLIINTCLVQENIQILDIQIVMWTYWVLIFSTICTTVYSIRLIYYVFFKPFTSCLMSYNSISKIHITVPTTYKIVFSILIFFSIISGWYLKNLFVNSLFFSTSFYINLNNTQIEFIPFYILILPVILSILSVVIIFFQYYFNNVDSSDAETLFIFFNRKFYFDSIYNFFIGLPVMRLSFELYRTVDKGFVEYFGPLGVTRVVYRISQFIDSLHNRQFLWTWYLSVSCAIMMVVISHNLW